MLATLLEDPESKYSWAEQVGILLFRTIIGEGVYRHINEDAIEIRAVLGPA